MVFDSGPEQTIVERGWVLLEDGIDHLWYAGYNDDRSPDRALGHAISLDPSNPIRSKLTTRHQ